MGSWFDILTLQDPTLRLVAFGTIFLSVCASVIGSFSFLRKQSLLGDAIAHSILPGVTLAFILFQSKSPIILMSGALMSGLFSSFCIDWLSSKTKLNEDTSTALILSTFFAAGLVLLTSINQSASGNQSGLDHFLFGKAASMQKADLYTYSAVALVLLLSVGLGFKELLVFSFNPEFAKSIGLPTKTIGIGLSSLTTLAITIGIQTVGVVLMAALLIMPAAAARSWTSKMKYLLVYAAFFGALAAYSGAIVSYSAPSMPTGPWIVISLSAMAILSLLLAPHRGLLPKKLRSFFNRRKIASENLLKTLYYLGEKKGNLNSAFSKEEINEQRQFSLEEFQLAKRFLKKKHWIISNQSMRLTKKGSVEARRIVRLHRLWELYLNKKMHLKPDHLHPNAEIMEHLITEDLEKRLIAELGQPEFDPHHSPIPYKDE